jgi:dTDP-4-dehydrorhamnose 3,5-epimerase
MTTPRFDFLDTDLPGLKLVRRKLLEDHRGFFERMFCADTFQEEGFAPAISQINHTLTKRIGTVRGLHFQRPPHAETKLVTCLKGRVFDVAVDLRSGSPTFLQWKGFELSEANQTSLLIPQGFAHGFQTLEADCELLYLHTTPYTPEAEDGLHPLDPALAIPWPQEVVDLSNRDHSRPKISPRFKGLSR